MQVDNPSPSSFFVAVMLFFIFLVTILPLYTMGFFTDPSVMQPIAIPFFLTPLVIFVLIIHAGYHTEYQLNENTLDLRCGWLIKGRYLYKDIEAVTPVRFNSRTLGASYRQKGFCNRFTNGLCLHIGKDKVFISPSDNERFQFELQLKIQHLKKSLAE
ncbi:MAG TPA: PH domain-containing protein [bacterium]|nr:PH domain-containing protein [bacterium]HPN44337.1 PH domain-containing protein [bacterium]